MRTIKFIDSAYPKTHLLEEFTWSGRLDDFGRLWFDLHLKSQDYYLSEGEDYIDDEDDDDSENTSINQWQSAIVWDNYHQCTISSAYWSNDRGILLTEGEERFNFDSVNNKQFLLDTLPLSDDKLESDLAFEIYLHGHDLCANHNLVFTKLDNGLFDIKWNGMVALAYSGFYEFIHEFNAHIPDAIFDGFYFPTTWSLDEASERFKKVLTNFEKYEFVDLNPKSNKREYKLMLSGV